MVTLLMPPLIVCFRSSCFSSIVQDEEEEKRLYLVSVRLEVFHSLSSESKLFPEKVRYRRFCSCGPGPVLFRVLD